MDYDAMKEQWGEVEDRDGVRLSWNVFPSSRMVRTHTHKPTPASILTALMPRQGGVTSSRPYWRAVYAIEREAGHAAFAIRACHLQAALSLRLEPPLVSPACSCRTGDT